MRAIDHTINVNQAQATVGVDSHRMLDTIFGLFVPLTTTKRGIVLYSPFWSAACRTSGDTAVNIIMRGEGRLNGS